MRNNGNTRNFTLPIYDKIPDPDEGELIILRGSPKMQDGIYIYMAPSWRFIKSEIGDQYEFPTTMNKYSGRRSANLVVNSQTWVDIPIGIQDFKDKSYSQTLGTADVIINKRSRYSIECQVSAMRSSGVLSVPYAVRLMQRPSNGNACTLIPIWQPNVIYYENDQVQRNGVLYQANWYTLNQDPTTNSAQYAVWTNKGACINGPATFQPIEGSYSYGNCDISNVGSSNVSVRAELSLYSGSAIKAQVAVLSNSGSITLLANSFRFNISEG